MRQQRGAATRTQNRNHYLINILSRISEFLCCLQPSNENVDENKELADIVTREVSEDTTTAVLQHQKVSVKPEEQTIAFNPAQERQLMLRPASNAPVDQQHLTRSNVEDHQQQSKDDGTVGLVDGPSVQETSNTHLQKPTVNDLQYRMLEQYVHFDPIQKSSEVLVASVAEGAESDASDQRATVAESSSHVANSNGTFRRIHIHYDGDEHGKKARVQHIMHDTGSAYSLTFASKLKNLKLMWVEQQMPALTSVQGKTFRPLGVRQIFYSYYDYPHERRSAQLIVLRDPPNGMVPTFDILFGRDTIDQNGALKWDVNVIGVNAVRLAKHSIFTSSPRVSVHSKLSEETEDRSD